VVGPDLRAGQSVQLLIPGDTFHTARLLGDGRWFFWRQHRMAGRHAAGR
jgi:predicted cupin superfamily sugar epimerase